MNHYATEMMVQSRQSDLLREANNARLAKLAREHQSSTPARRVHMRLAVRQLAAAASALLR